MNLLEANATGAESGNWLEFAGYRLGTSRVHFFLEGTHGGATYTLSWRPSGSSGDGMRVAEYAAPATDFMVSLDLAPGEVKVVITGGTSVDCMPQLLY